MEKKAERPVILNVKDLFRICDYFVICSAETFVQVKAIYEEVLKKSRQNNIDIHHRADDPSGRWFVIDFFDVFLHIFISEARQFYNLEYLWKEAKRMRVAKAK